MTSDPRFIFLLGFAGGVVFTYSSVLLSRILKARAEQAKRNGD